MTYGTLNIELTFVFHPISTNCHAIHCVSSLTYYFSLLCISVFINTIFGQLHFNCSSFTAFVCLWMVGCEARYLLPWIHTLDSYKNYSVFGRHILTSTYFLLKDWTIWNSCIYCELLIEWFARYKIFGLWVPPTPHLHKIWLQVGIQVLWDVMLSLGDWLWCLKGSLPSSARSRCGGHLEL